MEGATTPERHVLLLGDRWEEELVRRLGDAGLSLERVDRDLLGRADDQDGGRIDAGDGVRDGVQEAEGAPPPVLVLVDDPSDLSHLREVRDALPHHPILAVSAGEAELPASSVRDAGCDGAVDLSACHPRDVVSRIVAASERRSLLSQAAQLESRLEVSDARFRNTVQRIADGIIILDGDARVRFVNEAALELFGREPDELLNEEFGFPVTAGETTEVELLPAGSEPVLAELRTTRTEWEDREALLVSLRDVTRQRRAEEQERELIREQSARREAEAAADRGEFLAEASRALYASLESEDVLQALAELTAQKAGDVCVVETLVSDLHLPQNRTVAPRPGFAGGPVPEELRSMEEPILGGDAAERVIREGEPVLIGPGRPEWSAGVLRAPGLAERLEEEGLETILLTPLIVGNKIVGVLATLHFSGGRALGPADQALVEELGRRAGLALENARLYRLASQASRAKSDFLNVVSHELRTPLTGIMGYTGLMKEGLAGPLEEGQDTYLDGIERNSQQLLRIIDQILLFADTEEERQEVRFADESVRALVEDVVGLARPMAERKGLELRTDAPREDVRVRMDAGKARQIALHLLANAVKFTPEGWIELRLEVRPKHFVIAVSDSGIGIAEDKHDEVFEPFNQIEASQTRVAGGTGIGLNVVKNLTQLLGGTITLESASGEGSTFTVKLPLEAPSEVQRKSGDEEPREADSGIRRRPVGEDLGEATHGSA